MTTVVGSIGISSSSGSRAGDRVRGTVVGVARPIESLHAMVAGDPPPKKKEARRRWPPAHARAETNYAANAT